MLHMQNPAARQGANRAPERDLAGGEIVPEFKSLNLRFQADRLVWSCAVAIAEAPFVELENQSRDLAAMAACGFLAKQDAVDVAYAASLAAIGCGTWYRHDPDAIQEIIATGFQMAKPKPERVKLRPYRTPEATVDAFWYVVRLNDEDYLTRWLADHPDDSAHLKSLLEAKCSRSS